MVRPYIPLNALRSFEAAARHLSFTNAASELHVTHAAVSQQVKSLEQQLGCQLFVRVSRGLMLTPEGESLLPVLNDSFDRIADTLDRFWAGQVREKLKVGVVGSFAIGLLLPRIDDFNHHHPHIELQLSTHNNRVDPAAEGHDYTIRFGNGAWHGTEAQFICDAPLSPLCIPAIARQLQHLADVHKFTLLRSFRRDEWSHWLQSINEHPPSPAQPVMIFDSSLTMIEAALMGTGIALAPCKIFNHLLQTEKLIRPFAAEINLGGYWLTRLQTRAESPAMKAFSSWLLSFTPQSVDCNI
ncbi:LysR family transcriptional regulator AmpR [Rahnella sp. PD12R]|uniref:LysR family transcriptional regulator AmpR n=1 Tax=Rahnella sp. PD12R TaxID=2855688 RepID=UPI001C47E901|nr:LysR family transcriptional regulator AmpR [Rahnella sp. PD12R]MBV6817874.1 LysR family transcriptional regulator AmpR [Rahnella sp. PD12R]